MTWLYLPVLQLMLLLMLALLAIWLVVWVIGKIMDALTEPTQSPTDKLIGQLGRVTAVVSVSRGGKVVVAGEIWDAVLVPDSPEAHAQGLNPDERVRIVGFDPQDPQTLQVTRL